MKEKKEVNMTNKKSKKRKNIDYARTRSYTKTKDKPYTKKRKRQRRNPRMTLKPQAKRIKERKQRLEKCKNRKVRKDKQREKKIGKREKKTNKSKHEFTTPDSKIHEPSHYTATSPTSHKPTRYAIKSRYIALSPPRLQEGKSDQRDHTRDRNLPTQTDSVRLTPTCGLSLGLASCAGNFNMIKLEGLRRSEDWQRGRKGGREAREGR